MAVEIESKGWWGRGITVYNYEYGVFAVKDGLISFTRNPKFKPHFIFPITDVKRVKFGNQRQMQLYTDHGKYACYWYLGSQQVLAFGPDTGVEFNVYSIRGWKQMVDYNDGFCKQWEPVFSEYNIPFSYSRRINPGIVALFVTPLIVALIAWWAFKDGLNP